MAAKLEMSRCRGRDDAIEDGKLACVDEVDERLEVAGWGFAGVGEVDAASDLVISVLRACAEPFGAAKINGLRGDHELGCDDVLAEADHLLEAAGGEWRHRGPIFDPLGDPRCGDIERDGLGEQPSLRGERG